MLESIKTSNLTKPYQFIKFTIELFGIWTERPSKRFYFCRTIFIIIYIIFNITCALGFYHALKTAKLVVLCSNFAILFVTGLTSTTILWHCRRTPQNWLTDMFRGEQFLNNHPSRILRKIYQSAIRNMWPELILQINKWSMSIAVLIFFIGACLHIHEMEKRDGECVADPECRMVFMNYYHFPWNADKHYWLANLENVVFGGLLALMLYCRDMYFTGFICYLRCRLRSLSYVVRNLNQFMNAKFNNLSNFEETDDILKQCIEEHQAIIREFEVLKKNLSIFFFLVLIIHTQAVVNMTIITFQNDNDNINFTLFVYSAAFYGCSHLFLILWLSEELSFESVQVAESVYCSNWYEMDIKHQKVLRVMLLRAQRPLTLSCGALIPANLSTFLKSMKTIYTILNAFITLSK